MSPQIFHSAVDAWFRAEFAAPTPAQSQAWPRLKAGRNVLIATPTGSGKTLAAFLAAIDDRVHHGVDAPLPDETFVVYVWPLKALSNDIRKNLAAPLDGIREALKRRLAGSRDPHAGAHRRHAAVRAYRHAQPAAPHRRHHTRVAVRAAQVGVGPANARRAHGDRRRDPRARVEQARQPP